MEPHGLRGVGGPAMRRRQRAATAWPVRELILEGRFEGVAQLLRSGLPASAGLRSPDAPGGVEHAATTGSCRFRSRWIRSRQIGLRRRHRYCTKVSATPWCRVHDAKARERLLTRGAVTGLFKAFDGELHARQGSGERYGRAPQSAEAHSISRHLTRCRSSGPADWSEPRRGSLSHAARRSRCHGSSRRPPCANERMSRQDHGRVGGIARSDTTPRFSSSRMLTVRTRSLWSRRAFRTWPRSFSPPPADNCRRFASSRERCPGTRSASTRHRSSSTMRQTEGTSSNEPCV